VDKHAVETAAATVAETRNIKAFRYWKAFLKRKSKRKDCMAEQHDSREDQRQVKHANNFLNDEERQPSPTYLERLRDEGTIDSHEELTQIAESYNIIFHDAATHQELFDKIMLALDQEADNDQINIVGAPAV
jgi:hypothetical protein